uniref:FMRFamide-related neuropeptides-like n=1 Tax=Parastrongyloides trichosuri TaxID=131310 RepID=A0A0N4ZHQ9_PARTI
MFKFYSTIFIAFLLVAASKVVLTQSSPTMDNHGIVENTPDQASAYEMFCRDYSHLQLCKLELTLQQALAELQYIILNDDPSEEIESFRSKRKSAFVRFGKRSSDDDMFQNFDKRKSAFVRFGRSIEDPINGQKRKSSYVRFG